MTLQPNIVASRQSCVINDIYVIVQMPLVTTDH